MFFDANMTFSASAKAERPSFPPTRGGRRVLTQSANDSSSASSGSVFCTSSLRNEIPGCSPSFATFRRRASRREKSMDIYSWGWKYRNFLTFSVLTRLAVKLATAPFQTQLAHWQYRPGLSGREGPQPALHVARCPPTRGPGQDHESSGQIPRPRPGCEG